MAADQRCFGQPGRLLRVEFELELDLSRSLHRTCRACACRHGAVLVKCRLVWAAAVQDGGRTEFGRALVRPAWRSPDPKPQLSAARLNDAERRALVLSGILSERLRCSPSSPWMSCGRSLR